MGTPFSERGDCGPEDDLINIFAAWGWFHLRSLRMITLAPSSSSAATPGSRTTTFAQLPLGGLAKFEGLCHSFGSLPLLRAPSSTGLAAPYSLQEGVLALGVRTPAAPRPTA